MKKDTGKEFFPGSKNSGTLLKSHKEWVKAKEKQDPEFFSQKEDLIFDEQYVLHELKHYLPSQTPLKDFNKRLVAVATKFAQLPFSSWLSRAMEGPTTSSAIFYGSVSVHIGVFLLLGTYPFWENIVVIRIGVVIIGLATGVFAAGKARVQSTVKTQIAYSSIVQLGIIFIEVALGFHILALIHFAGNAFLRTYQLLVSPSVLSYLIHDQFYNFITRKHNKKDSAFKKILNSFYVLSIKEWNLDFLLHRFLGRMIISDPARSLFT
jgi:hypothetical protein